MANFNPQQKRDNRGRWIASKQTADPKGEAIREIKAELLHFANWIDPQDGDTAHRVIIKNMRRVIDRYEKTLAGGADA